MKNKLHKFIKKELVLMISNF